MIGKNAQVLTHEPEDTDIDTEFNPTEITLEPLLLKLKKMASHIQIYLIS